MVEIKQSDRDFYKKYIADNIPDCIYDTHAHLWTDAHIAGAVKQDGMADWVHKFCAQHWMSYEGLKNAYAGLFFGKKVSTLAFGWVENNVDISSNNQYVGAQAKKYGFSGLAVSRPEFNEEELFKEVSANNLIGLKPYPTFAPAAVPGEKVRITDMITKRQLSLANQLGWVVMLHIPRAKRIADRANIEDILMIEKEFPNIKLIIAHIGRAYCLENIGEAFNILKKTKNVMFDFAAHTNAEVFEKAIDAFGAKRLLFGTDFPISLMRLKREHKCGNYINYIPAGSCGDVINDAHMKEVLGEEAGAFTFFVYESMAAMIRAAKNRGLTQKSLNDIFYQNAVDFIGLKKICK